MVNNMKKYSCIICFIFIIFLMIAYFFTNMKLKLYSRDIFYMDTYINIKVYSNKKNIDKILDNCENIYKSYHELTDRYNSYDGIVNLYYINNNKSDKEFFVDKKLYDLIGYASSFSKETNGLFDINLGGVIDVWKKYRDNSSGVPSKSELKKNVSKDAIVLLGDNKIKNNDINIDLGAVSKGYTTGLVGEYLKSEGIEYFLINAGGNVLAGKSYNKEYYKIGIQSPNKDGGVIGVVKGVNISVVTSGGYERNYQYDGKLYHHIISPKTLFPTDYMKSVTIVSSDSGLADMLSTTLFLMDIESGKEFIKKYDAEAIWVDNNDNIIKSDGFDKYE